MLSFFLAMDRCVHFRVGLIGWFRILLCPPFLRVSRRHLLPMHTKVIAGPRRGLAHTFRGYRPSSYAASYMATTFSGGTSGWMLWTGHTT